MILIKSTNLENLNNDKLLLKKSLKKLKEDEK